MCVSTQVLAVDKYFCFLFVFALEIHLSSRVFGDCR